MNPASSHPVRVLIAEDDMISRMVVIRMAEMLGCACTQVDNGRSAVEACREAQERFDLVLMDIEMPEMDGLEAATALQQHFEEIALPQEERPWIVALTGEIFESKMELYRKAGFDHCLGKPLKFERLQALMEELNLAGKK